MRVLSAKGVIQASQNPLLLHRSRNKINKKKAQKVTHFHILFSMADHWEKSFLDQLGALMRRYGSIAIKSEFMLQSSSLRSSL